MTPRDTRGDTRGDTTKSRLRMFYAVIGLVAFLSGVLSMSWSDDAAQATTIVLGFYFVTAGILYALAALFSTDTSVLGRCGHFIIGAAYMVVGVIGLANATGDTDTLAVTFVVTIGISWIIEAILSATAYIRGSAPTWAMFYAFLAFAAGILAFISVVWMHETMIYFIGYSLIVLGAVQFGRGLVYRGHKYVY